MYDKSQLMRGTLEGCILQILYRETTYGYQIVTSLTEYGFEDIKEGTITDRVIRQVDVAPTIAEILGVRKPEQCEGAPVYQILKK